MKVALGEKTYVYDGEEFHSQFGVIKGTGRVESSTGKKFTIADPLFIDKWKKMKRKAQMPLLKDIGAIIAYTGIGPESTIVDAGAGSGGIALFLAHLVKRVCTYDMREDHCEVVRKNIEFLDLKNVEVQCRDITEGIDETDVDVCTLDVPEPWTCLQTLEAVRLGGAVVAYVPNLTQVQRFVLAVQECDHFLFEKVLEMTEREWKVSEKIMKPFSDSVHSGFLIFLRRI